MGITANSWWQNRRTGQKMAVADSRIMCSSVMRSSAQATCWEHRFGSPKMSSRRTKGTVHFGLGRPPDRIPCHLEGKRLYLAWLTEDEIRAAWKLFRPRLNDRAIPMWIRKPREFNDFLLYDKPVREIPDVEKAESVWVSVQRIRSGWLCLTGIVQNEITSACHEERENGRRRLELGYFNWGLQAYNTYFLPASNAVPRMLPRFGSAANIIRKTAYERVADGILEP